MFGRFFSFPRWQLASQTNVGQTTHRGALVRREKILMHRQKIILFKKIKVSKSRNLGLQKFEVQREKMKKKILRRRRKKFVQHCLKPKLKEGAYSFEKAVHQKVLKN